MALNPKCTSFTSINYKYATYRGVGHNYWEMKYENSSTALLLDYKNLKDSLIYFDQVIPLFHQHRKKYSKDYQIEEDQYGRILDEVLPNDLKKDSKVANIYDEFISNDLFLLMFFRKIWKFGYEYAEDPYSHPETEMYLNARNSIFYNLDKSSQSVQKGVFTSFSSNNEFNESDNVRLSLMKLDLVDTKTIPFEQILELRKDKSSIEKLRNLQLFFYQNYDSKPKAFIEDDILKRLHDYKETVKHWNLKTGLSSINGFLSSKVLMSSIAASLTSAFLGNFTISAITASSGVTIELGKLVISMTKESLDKNEKLRQDPISFLYELDKLK